MIHSSFMSIFIVTLPVLLGIYGLFYLAARRFQHRFDAQIVRIQSLEDAEASLKAEREDLLAKLAHLKEDYERLLKVNPQ